MKTTLRTALIMMVAFTLMAGMGWAKKEMKPSGFLSDYSKLQEGGACIADFCYLKEGVDFKPYDKIMIDHLVFFMSEDAEYKGIQPDELNDMAATWHRAFIESLEGDFEIVHEPGPGVLRFRAAITDLSPTKRALNTITTVVPVGLAFSILKKGVTGAAAGVGKVTAEAEVLDSLTNEVLAACVDFKAGNKYRVDQAASKWGYLRVAIEGWAKRLRDRLAEISGK
jgi:hypothetical protein